MRLQVATIKRAQTTDKWRLRSINYKSPAHQWSDTKYYCSYINIVTKYFTQYTYQCTGAI